MLLCLLAAACHAKTGESQAQQSQRGRFRHIIHRQFGQAGVVVKGAVHQGVAIAGLAEGSAEDVQRIGFETELVHRVTAAHRVAPPVAVGHV
jgi:hypothetical protein